MFTYAGWINLKTIKRLPHPNNVSGLRISPQMMGPECPMVYLRYRVNILYTKDLTTNINKLLNPVVLYRVINLKKSVRKP